MNVSHKGILPVAALLLLFHCSTASLTFLVPDKPEEADKKVKQTMEQFGAVETSEENEGYLYSYNTDYLHPFSVKYYIGSHLGGDGSTSIVRIEGDKNDAMMLEDIISQQYKMQKVEYPRSYDGKSQAINHTLNVISPGLAYMYGAFGTPRRSAWSGILWGSTMLLSDFLLYIFASKAFFFNDVDSFSGKAFEENWAVIAAFNGGFRLINAYYSHLHISGHNRGIQLGYKFRLRD